MLKLMVWSIALLCILVLQAVSARKGNPTGADYYTQCAAELGLSHEMYQSTPKNKTSMLCLQKCVFEKDGTLDKKHGTIMKSDLMEYLLATLFGNDAAKKQTFQKCLSNMLPLGRVKHCWDIDKLIYCLVSNMDLMSPMMGMPSQQNGFQFPGMPGMQQMPGMHQFPGMTGMPSMDDMSGMGGILGGMGPYPATGSSNSKMRSSPLLDDSEHAKSD